MERCEQGSSPRRTGPLTGVDLTRARAAVDEAAAAWGLTLGTTFPAQFSVVVAAGDHAVVKAAWEGDDESLHEADALELWGGTASVRLLARRGTALLLERAQPGVDATALDESVATSIAVDLAHRLWRPARPPFRPVVPNVGRWIAGHETVLSPLARDLLRSITPGTAWLVHGDFRHQNVLRHGEVYVAIDPKPYLADREYDVFSWLRNPLPERPLLDRERTERRIAAFVASGLDDARIRAWAVIRGSYLCDDPAELAAVHDLLDR